MWHLFLFLFLHFQLIFSWSFNLSSSPSPNKLCLPEQSFSLLHFKNSISVFNDSSLIYGGCHYYPKTNSWKESGDCCSWNGVTCDKLTGHVIGLDLSCSWLHGTLHDNSSLFLLHHLQQLNLSYNYFFESSISSKFGQFKELTHLDLSSSMFSGLVPNEIFYLSKLVSLDLSYSCFVFDILSKFGQFKGLTLLDLSSSEFSGLVPNEIFFLSKLVSLDLSYNYDTLEISQDSFTNMLQNLTKLRYLYLDDVNMSSVAAASLVNLSSSIISLSLAGTNLKGRLPSDIFHLPFLQRLSLVGNDLLTGSLPKSNWSGPLRLLDLFQTPSFSSELPDTIGNLKYLNELNLFQSNFTGSIPASLGNLTAITSLSLSHNHFTGQVPTSISKLGELTVLDLEDNAFSGKFPDAFGNLSKLAEVNVAHNNFSGPLPSSAFNLPQISTLFFRENQFEGQIPCPVSDHLELLCLDNNKLSGQFPNCIFDLVNITELDLSSNNLSGILKSDKFSKLKSLESIDLSHNRLLSLTPSINSSFTLPKLGYFSFSSCNLTTVPMFLRYAKKLGSIDLSNNRISGNISGHLFESLKNLVSLNLSHNFITSFQKIPLDFNPIFLDLQSNSLQGPLFDQPFDGIQYFSVSNNNLTGEIPSSFCNLTSLVYLSLSYNTFNGTIPKCLGNIGSLSALDLSMNNFHGSIPQSLANNNLEYLTLNGNQLEGPLPSFFNSSELTVLEVGNNKINDTFPHSLSSLPKLEVLILRSNRFQGHIGSSTTGFAFPKLRILDLSHNQFSGNLPRRYFENFEAMMQGAYHNVDMEYMEIQKLFQIGTTEFYSIILTMKGNSMKMKILNIFTAIDLSDNLFQGRIPEALGKLDSLKVLNISNNKLTGHIPSSIQNLTEVESLDLSSNKLVGEIPVQLASLTSLEVLNLSYNQLVGAIPRGPQLDTFQSDSFIGNLGLCGFQLPKKCGNNEAQEPFRTTRFQEGDHTSSSFDSKVMMMGYASGLVIGMSVGYIVFATRRPKWFVRMVERKQSMTVTRRMRVRARCRGRN